MTLGEAGVHRGIRRPAGLVRLFGPMAAEQADHIDDALYSVLGVFERDLNTAATTLRGLADDPAQDSRYVVVRWLFSPRWPNSVRRSPQTCDERCHASAETRHDDARAAWREALYLFKT